MLINLTDEEMTDLLLLLKVRSDLKWRPLLTKLEKRQSDRAAQLEELKVTLAKGYKPPEDWRDVMKRYKDRDRADDIPREWMMMDIGYLIGTIHELMQIIRSSGNQGKTNG